MKDRIISGVCAAAAVMGRCAVNVSHSGKGVRKHDKGTRNLPEGGLHVGSGSHGTRDIVVESSGSTSGSTSKPRF